MPKHPPSGQPVTCRHCGEPITRCEACAGNPEAVGDKTGAFGWIHANGQHLCPAAIAAGTADAEPADEGGPGDDDAREPADPVNYENVSGRDQPRPAGDVTHDVRFGSSVTGIYAYCDPCEWSAHIDDGHTAGELVSLATQHCTGEPA